MPTKTSVVRWIVTFPVCLLTLVGPYRLVDARTDELRLPPPVFVDAVRRWRDGRAADALATLDRRLAQETQENSDQPLEALILRATLHNAVGHPAEAERLWQTVIEREVWMRTFARRALVTSLADRGAPADAEPILAALNRSDDTRHLDLTLMVADAYHALGRIGEARRLYQLVVDRQPRSDLADTGRLGAAATLEAEGDTEGAIAQLRAAQRLHRTGLAYEAARSSEQRLSRAYILPVAPLSYGAYRSLVRRLRGASRSKSALALIDEWSVEHAPPGGDPLIEAERIETLYTLRANTEAIEACRRFYARFPTSSLVPDIRLTDFRLAVRMVDTERARRTGLDLWEGRVPGASADHRWNAGNLLAAYLVAAGDLDTGLAFYSELLSTAATADRQRELLWRAGIAALRAGEHERALNNLRALLDRAPTGELVPAGLYWLARAEAHEHPEVSIRRLREIVRRFPFHYYGMRALEQLEAADRTLTAGPLEPALRFPDLTVGAGSVDRPEYKAAMALARAGRVADAAWYLRRLLSQRPGERGLALLAARASFDADDHASVTRIVVNHLGEFLERPAVDLPDDFWRLVYPRPFWEDVRRSAQTHNVNPMLMLSVMRRESRFDPDAPSPVGAVGLFQIMTYTAEALAESAGVGHILADGLDEEALTAPAVNAAIAARLTSGLLDMFDRSPAPAVAAYNAGEERVAVWWKASTHLSEDFFVDTIPYSETRRFVREVLANRAAYARVYGE